MKYFYDIALSEKSLLCLSDERCNSYNNIGICNKCIPGHKLVDNRCVCSNITDCISCPSAKECSLCKEGKVLNKVVIPN